MPYLYNMLKSISFSDANKSYGIFISHAWDFHSEYLRLIELLYSIKDFKWYNCTRYQCDIIPDNIDIFHEYLPGLLMEQIQESHCFLLISDLYREHRYWIQKEMDMAGELNKPIIAIKSRVENSLPSRIVQSAKEIVEWNPESIVNAIKKRCKL